jgi:hypothetical protein
MQLAKIVIVSIVIGFLSGFALHQWIMAQLPYWLWLAMTKFF